MKNTLRALLCVSLYAAVLGACSKDDGAADKAPATKGTTKGSGTLCVANQTVFCRCGPETGKAAGTEGVQLCARDGKSFGECGPCVAEDEDPPDVPPVSCGNNTREGTEECDDGNQVDTDGCTHFCKYASCGDGFVQAGREECDDGNTKAGDGCSPACGKETAGADPCKDAGEECTTTGLGACAKGKLVCQSNALVCVADKTAAAEDTCGNGVDDDCNGKVDDNDCPCSHDLCTQGAALSECNFTVDKDGKNKACLEAICAKDDICCANTWDATCVKAVQLFCGRLSCEASKGACSHTLCSTGEALTPDCDKGNGTAAVTSCVAKICAEDATCCTEQWDQPCVDRVISVCAKKCDK